MTSRQRFRETMRLGTPDRVPYFEEGIRQDVLSCWYQQGLSPDTNLSDLFPCDRFEEIALDVNPLPALTTWPTSRRDLDLLRDRLNPEDPARWPAPWQDKVRFWQAQDQVLFLRVHRGFFLSMGVYNWQRFNEVITLLVDDPAFVREAMMLQGEFAARLADHVLQDITVDAAIFSEPISGNEGPLISPDMYEDFVLSSYTPLLDVLKKHGVEAIIYRTYANTRLFIPRIMAYGFNTLWACETNVDAMDYRGLRRAFGRDLRLIGGLDLDALRHTKEAIRREVEEKVPPLMADGGFVPMADGRVRKDIPFEHYVYYRRLLEQIIHQ